MNPACHNYRLHRLALPYNPILTGARASLAKLGDDQLRIDNYELGVAVSAQEHKEWLAN